MCVSSHLYPGNGTWDAPASCSFSLKSPLPINWDTERACHQLLPFSKLWDLMKLLGETAGRTPAAARLAHSSKGRNLRFQHVTPWNRASSVWRHRVHVSDLVSGQEPVIADLCCSVSGHPGSVWMTYDVSVYRACFSISPLLHACCNNVSAVLTFDSRTHSICFSSTPRFSCSMRLRD
jgi:hypothetical protein